MLQLQKKAQQLIKHIAIILAFLLMLSSPVAAQDYDKGLAAYINEDYATAFKEWKPLAEQGLAIAQLNLGIMYSNGQGVVQDYKEAVKWYKLAAKQGLSPAQFNLSLMYRKGWGVPKDYVEAYKWANLSSANGHSKGAELRELIAVNMTPAQVEKAQNYSRECIKINYKGCC